MKNDEEGGGAFPRTECSRKAHGCSHRLVQVAERSDGTPQKTVMAKGGKAEGRLNEDYSATKSPSAIEGNARTSARSHSSEARLSP